MIDFTDSSNPVEIAYFDRGPIDAEQLVTGGFWSTYFYKGRIYGTEIIRGLDVLALLPSEFISENEIAAAAVADQGELFNPQQQFPVTWPADPVVARAYIDQLQRSNALSDDLLADLDAALNRLSTQGENRARDRKLASDLKSLAKAVENSGGEASRSRSGLADTLRSMAR